MVAETHLRFRAPAHFDDEVAVGMAIARLGRSSIVTELSMQRGDELLVEGELRHVVVSAETWQSVEMPGFIRDGLSPYSTGS